MPAWFMCSVVALMFAQLCTFCLIGFVVSSMLADDDDLDEEVSG